MARGTLERLTQATPAALGTLRAVISGVFLVSIIDTSFSTFARLPVTLMRPVGGLQLFSWAFYDRLFTAAGMTALKWALLTSLFLSTIGYLTPVSTKLSALLIIFYQGLLRSFGHFNHDEMVGIYCLIVLAFSPCGDAFSVDSLPLDRLRRKSLFAYGYPILLMQLLLAWSYFSSALIKIRFAGLAYFSPDNLPALAIYHSLDNLHDTHFRFAFSLPAFRQYTLLLIGLVLAWELLFPLAIFWKRARWWILGFGIVFHLATLFLMSFFFTYTVAMYALFVDWPRVLAWFRRRFGLNRLSSWWRRFRLAPETFPGLRITGLGEGGVLLWDGECDFCARMVNRLKRFVKVPFAELPYQAIADKLPLRVRRWCDCQAHWINDRGEVTGGSAALIELIDASGRRVLASLLDTTVCRPFLWFGYRLVANYRSYFAKFI